MRWLIWICTICQCPSTKPSPGFTDNTLYTALWRHSDKKSAAANKRYRAVWFQWSTIITWNNLKETWVHVYFGSIVNNRPKKLYCGEIRGHFITTILHMTSAVVRIINCTHAVMYWDDFPSSKYVGIAYTPEKKIPFLSVWIFMELNLRETCRQHLPNIYAMQECHCHHSSSNPDHFSFWSSFMLILAWWRHGCNGNSMKPVKTTNYQENAEAEL